MNKNNKKILSIVLPILLALSILAFLYSPVIFQEGNPWPQIKGAAQLNFTNQKIVRLSDTDNLYMTKSKNGAEVINSYLKNQGFDFVDQMGSGYFYQSSKGNSVVAVHKYYSRFYSLWRITENSNTNANFWSVATTNDGISFQYPKELSTKYISVADWPPQIKIEDKQFNCVVGGNEIQLGGQTEPRTINGRSYCVTKASEGAAGSVYTTYTYDFPIDNKTGVITFSLRFVQCKNYDDPKMTECESERVNFDVDSVVWPIMESLNVRSTWDMVVDLLNRCEVKSVFQTHSKLVTLELKNGSEITAYEPQIDEVMKVVTSLKDKCGDLRLATE